MHKFWSDCFLPEKIFIACLRLELVQYLEIIVMIIYNGTDRDSFI